MPTNTYTPSAWVIVKFDYKDDNDNFVCVYRILAGWYGSYTSGDSWKLSSAITKIDISEEGYVVYNQSGSLYNCNKDVERMIGITSNIYHALEEQLKETPASKMEIVNIKTILDKKFSS